ncbi:hypothetical protein [Shewanella sp. NIFS-20-20]|uniref:hypothetical protein n=1 Tax=Shewanella sp. NIFS-20-20 TaxID=2853806 RepID=UPI001C46464B|nr:hypothetical protein [Shewanella sp. NIFS-20-20]MBV7314761.1 hypothetical protein [Shewanella sp. NIFS-20-20]
MLNNEAQALIRQCANDYRCGNEGFANVHYLACLDVIQAYYQAQPGDELLAIMRYLLEAQERQDWLGMADTLEYELLSFLVLPTNTDAPASSHATEP